jgi:hypothetical protein
MGKIININTSINELSRKVNKIQNRKNIVAKVQRFQKNKPWRES